MKKTLSMLAALVMTSTVFAQGTVEFGTFSSEIKRFDGTGAGTGYTAGLFLIDGQNLTAPIGTTDFIAGTGFLNPINVTVPGHAGRTPATFVIRAWDTTAGSYAAAAATSNLQRGESPAFTINSLGGAGAPPDVPASLDGSTYAGFTMTVVPEPTTYALGVLGLGALAMMRRRK
jgi:hypothetical protein